MSADPNPFLDEQAVKDKSVNTGEMTGLMAN